MYDSLKTSFIGFSGIWVTWMEWVPVLVRVAVGLATLAYMIYKAKNEYLKYENRKRVSKKVNRNSR